MRNRSEEEVGVPRGYGPALVGLAPAEYLTQYLLKRAPYTDPYRVYLSRG